MIYLLGEAGQWTNVGLDPAATGLVLGKQARSVVVRHEALVAQRRVQRQELLERTARIELAVAGHDADPRLGERGMKSVRRAVGRREGAQKSVDRR